MRVATPVYLFIFFLFELIYEARRLFLIIYSAHNLVKDFFFNFEFFRNFRNLLRAKSGLINNSPNNRAINLKEKRCSI